MSQPAIGFAPASRDFERRVAESAQRIRRKQISPLDEVRTRRQPAAFAAPVRTVVLGTGPLADAIAGQLGAHPKAYHFIGYVDGYGEGERHPQAIGHVKELDTIVELERVGCVVVAMADRRGRLPLDALLACKMSGIRVEDGISFLEKISGKIALAGLNPGTLIFTDGFRWPRQATKRAADILFASIFLLLAAAAFFVLPILIRRSSPGPVFYRQERVGLNGRRFAMMKFRSMAQNAESAGAPVWARENDPRVTPIGRIMRRFRLDELPQLLNVLRGDMSFVGPRPERPPFVQLLANGIPYYNLRHTVKPGITGWAQVNFRYGASIEDAAQKLQYDLYYVKHMSIPLDCRIALKTFKAVLFQSGAR